MGKIYNAYLRSYKLSPESNKDFFDCIGDVYFTEQVQSLSWFEQHKNVNRLDHITSVAYLSFLAAKKLGLDSRCTANAAVMHDLFYYDWHSDEKWHRPHGYLHPRFALENAKLLCGDIDKKTADIIVKHMWPLTPQLPRYRESYIVSMADKYCAFREFLIARFPYFENSFKAGIK